MCMTRMSERISFVRREVSCIWVCNAEGGKGREERGGRLSGDLDNLTYLDIGLDGSWARGQSVGVAHDDELWEGPLLGS